MGLTYEQAKALGIPWPDDLPKRGGSLAAPSGGLEPPDCLRVKIPSKNPKGQNKTEARYDAHLADYVQIGTVLAYAFEPFKWRLAAKTWLTIDFAVWLAPDARLIGIDVKGFMRDDAAVKLKVFADKYPHIPLYVVSRIKHGWEYRVCGRGGIVPCLEPWHAFERPVASGEA